MARCSVSLIIVLAFSAQSFAEITLYYDKQEWQTTVGDYTTITFAELPNGTWVSNQYENLGITFEFDDFIHSQVQTQPYFTNDGAGLNTFGEIGRPLVRFTPPMYAIAIDSHYSVANFILLYQGTFVGDVTVVSSGYFKGVVSTLPFDEVRGMPKGIDDLFFGPPIPAPGALGLCGVVLYMHRRRRR